MLTVVVDAMLQQPLHVVTMVVVVNQLVTAVVILATQVATIAAHELVFV